jgi:hypothetical protein
MNIWKDITKNDKSASRFFHYATNPLQSGYVQDKNPLQSGYIQDRNPLQNGYVQDKKVFGFE